MAGHIGLYQTVLAVASLGAVTALGWHGTLTPDAVAAIIAAVVAFVTGSQGATHAARTASYQADQMASTLNGIQQQQRDPGE